MLSLAWPDPSSRRGVIAYTESDNAPCAKIVVWPSETSICYHRYYYIGSMQTASFSVLWGVGKKRSALVSFSDRFSPFYVVNYPVTYSFHNDSTSWFKEDLAPTNYSEIYF